MLSRFDHAASILGVGNHFNVCCKLTLQELRQNFLVKLVQFIHRPALIFPILQLLSYLLDLLRPLAPSCVSSLTVFVLVRKLQGSSHHQKLVGMSRHINQIEFNVKVSFSSFILMCRAFFMSKPVVI